MHENNLLIAITLSKIIRMASSMILFGGYFKEYEKINRVTGR